MGAGLKSMAAGEQLQYRVQVTRVKDNDVATYQAGGSVELRITGLEANSDYKVRVAAERLPMGEKDSMVGSYSPTTQVAQSSWSDQKWAVIILSGFTLFAVAMAMVIQ